MSADRQPHVIHRAKELWHVTRSRPDSIQFNAIANGALAIDQFGRIIGVGRSSEFRYLNASSSSVVEVIDHGDAVLMPGFVDAHAHAPQMDVMGSGGYSLLQWLDHHVFPAEAKFGEVSVARDGARRLTREFKRHGVTAAAVFSSVHAPAADCLFSEFDTAGLRLLTGKTSMDVGAPQAVLQPVKNDIEDQQALIARWHGKSDRLHYAITPRFALSCSREMMRGLGDLRERNPTCYVQTHISETQDEVSAVKSVWRDCRDYLSVYADHGLIGEKTLLAHGIYLSDSEIKRIEKSKSSIVHCPTSNTFLGSGLFPLRRVRDAGVKVCLASDIGAGTTLSPWQTMLEAYKVQALQGDRPNAGELLYLSTLAGAEAMGMDQDFGSFEPGKYADFLVIKPGQKPLLAERIARAKDPEERLFACITHGDDRLIRSVFVAGEKVHDSESF
jgi:guanine deaminase